jgi:hypothetical protein
MFKQSLLLGSLSLVLLAMPSCGGDKKPCEGAEKCACYGNGTCDAGLDCRSNTCVNLSGGGGGPGVSFDAKKCLACAESACGDAASACKASSGCEAITSCLLACSTDAVCLANCSKGVTQDNVVKSGAYQVCAFTMCSQDCTPTLTGIGGFGNIGTGGASSSGGSTSKGGGSSTGGSNGGAGGSVPTEPVSGTNWLTLVEDAAPSTMGVNGKLGVEGVFYAYADPCSTDSMTWDPIQRCITGVMCASDSTGTNWGVSIGFDFNNVDSVKHAWSATTAGVKGIAWEGYSSSSTMQIWVQNMDPSFNGTCSSMNCNINAPPDGVPAASATGQFSFASMVKDMWGPDADSYVFNPANISALQFKLSAKPTESSYMLCIGKVGLVR